ncbi:MAG: SRPBCC family protein [Bacteroidota bacterium]
MKILKVLGITLLVLVVIYVVLALIGPAHSYVERSMVINSDAKTAFDNVNNLKTWKQWSYWDKIDPSMKSEYEGPESGLGAKHKWESANDSVGKGSLTISKVEENRLVETTLEFEGMGTSIGGWKFQDTTGGVKVTSYMDMDIPFFARPMMLFMDMDKMLGADFEKSLAGLKTLSESKPKKPEIKIEERTVSAVPVLTIRDTVMAMSEIGPKLGELYGEIGKFMKKEGLQMGSQPFAIYHSDTVIDGQPIVLEAGIHVDKMPKKTEGRIRGWTTRPGNVVCALHYGPYEETYEAYSLLKKWASDNNKKLVGQSWDVYITDPTTVKSPYEVLTEIYYYVE